MGRRSFIVRSALQAYDLRFEEDAAVLGVSKRLIVRRVRIPLLILPLTAAALAAFLVGWTDYVVTLIIGGGSVITIPLLVQSAASSFGNDSVVATISLISIVPPIFLLGASLLITKRISGKGIR